MSATDSLTQSIDHLVRSRRATRAFLADEVPTDTIEAVFELANQAPSNSNTQPWHVEVVSGPARQRLADAIVAAGKAGQISLDFPYSEDMYRDVLRDRRKQFGAHLYQTLGIDRDDAALLDVYNKKSLRFYGAPHVAMIFAPSTAEARIAADVGIYLQTLLLAMTAHGIASCPQGLLSFYADTVRNELGVEPDRRLLVGVAFGYADDAAPVNGLRVPRASLAETTRFHR
ncbi:nitroreductase [Mycobacterium sp. NPDC003323]